MLLTTEHRRTPSLGLAVGHPFLIARQDEYAELRARASLSPWKEQKAQALHDARTVFYNAAARIDVRAIVLARILSGTALAYILDPDERPYYLARIVEHLRAFDSAESGSVMADMRANPDKMLWRFGVPTGNAFFHAVLALDIIHDDLPPKELARIERMLAEGPARYFKDTNLAWRQGSLAARAIWPLYQRDAAVYGPIVEEWKRDTLRAITPDGVFKGGAGYADARWSFADREHKALFGEVLAHAGVLPDWYDEPQLTRFHEWLNGYAYTPFRIVWTIGDSGPDKFNGEYQPGGDRAYRYSRTAASYSAWLRNGAVAPAALGSYLLSAEQPSKPAAAPSRIFPDGGAWLKETSLDSRSLSAVLCNLKSSEDAHAHKETNSLLIAAYGELLLRAGGYNGWDTPEKGFSWAYIHDRAIAGNTVLFDYEIPETEADERTPSSVNDHISRAGDGIVSSLLTGLVDYAQGDSGRAIPNGHHVRNVLFIHPSDRVAGYYVIIDQLRAKLGAIGHVVWHPASSRHAEVAKNEEHNWVTNEFGGADVGLTIFLGTPPRGTLLCNGILANWDNGIIGKYLVSNYPIDDSGKKNVTTVLFPHDAAHPKATFSRLTCNGISGATITQGDIEDQVFESAGDTSIHLQDGVSVLGGGGWSRRRSDGSVISILLIDALRYTWPSGEFESTLPVTLFQKADTFHLTTKDQTAIVLRHSDLLSISVDTQPTAQVAAIEGVVRLSLPAGTHVLQAHLRSSDSNPTVFESH